MIKRLGEAGQISKTGILEKLPWMILVAEVLFLLVGSSLLEKGKI